MHLPATLLATGIISLFIYPPLGLTLLITAAITATIDTARTIKEWVKCL